MNIKPIYENCNFCLGMLGVIEKKERKEKQIRSKHFLHK